MGTNPGHVAKKASALQSTYRLILSYSIIYLLTPLIHAFLEQYLMCFFPVLGIDGDEPPFQKQFNIPDHVTCFTL